MNTAGISLLWLAIQVTLLCLLGSVIYLSVRRGDSATRSLLIVTIIAGVLGVSVASVSPWPAWQSSDVLSLFQGFPFALADATGSGIADDSHVPYENDVSLGNEPNAFAPSRSSTQLGSPARAFLRSLAESITAPGSSAENEFWSRWRPAAVFAVVFCAGTAVVMLRFIGGLFVVSRYRVASTLVDDETICRELDEIRQRAGIARPVALRESNSVSSAATIGWRQPMVLLPDDWRDWSKSELRAVLAHELAHVRRQDFLTGMLSQFCLALHFYHPLVHWLTRQLRLEQELAADAMGADLTGGRKEYLEALARLALRQDDRPVSWAARPFFPRRDTFLRRIEMLRHVQSSPIGRSPRPVRYVTVASTIAMALFVAGWRRSADVQNALHAQETVRQNATENAPTATDFNLIPRDAWLVAHVRFAELIGKEPLKSLVTSSPIAASIEKDLGMPVSQIDALTVVAIPVAPERQLQNGRSPAVIVFTRSKNPINQSEFLDTDETEEKNWAGITYFVDSNDGKKSVFFPNEYTVAAGEEHDIRHYAILKGTTQRAPVWLPDWKEATGSAISVGVNTPQLGQIMRTSAEAQKVLAYISPLVQQTNYAVGTIEFSQGLAFQVQLNTKDLQAVQSVSGTLQALITLAKNLHSNVQKQAAQAGPEGLHITMLLAQASTLLENAEIEHANNEVRLTSHSDFDVAVMMGFLLPAMHKAREAAHRVQSANNLKQIALAMHSYADQKAGFPPAVLYGPDGKTAYSWRVAILPYLDQKPLYDQYDFSQPWDSEKNLKLLDQMPAVYRSPTDTENKSRSAYFVLTGSGTAFGKATDGVEFREILDGTSNTLLAVEANREIPWTKPDDISFQADGELPELGGFFDNGFFAAFADGSVRFISSKIDPQVLRALITVAGGELIDLEKMSVR